MAFEAMGLERIVNVPSCRPTQGLQTATALANRACIEHVEKNFEIQADMWNHFDVASILRLSLSIGRLFVCANTKFFCSYQQTLFLK